MLLAAGACGPFLVVLLPLGWTVTQAFGVAWADALELLWRPLIGELLLNTLELVCAAALLAAVIGTACAWCVERTDVPFHGAWAVLAAAPLAVPPFITSYAWVSLSPALEGFAGALLVITVAYTPFVFLPVAAALRGMDPALEETARALGNGPWRCFGRVVLPQLRPALLGGMLLVALNTLVEFGAFTLLRFRTFTTELYAEYRTGMDGAESSLVATVLIALCVVCLVLELRVRANGRYSRVARFTGRRPARHALGRWRFPLAGLFSLLNVATLGIPLGMLLFWLSRHNSAAVATVDATFAGVIDALVSSVLLGAAGAAAALGPGAAARRAGGPARGPHHHTAGAHGVAGARGARHRGGARPSHPNPGVCPSPCIRQTPCSCSPMPILFLPLALVSVRAALLQAQVRLEETGRTLGLGPLATLCRVTLPLAGPGLGGGPRPWCSCPC